MIARAWLYHMVQMETTMKREARRFGFRVSSFGVSLDLRFWTRNSRLKRLRNDLLFHQGAGRFGNAVGCGSDVVLQ